MRQNKFFILFHLLFEFAFTTSVLKKLQHEVQKKNHNHFYCVAFIVCLQERKKVVHCVMNYFYVMPYEEKLCVLHIIRIMNFKDYEIRKNQWYALYGFLIFKEMRYFYHSFTGLSQKNWVNRLQWDPFYSVKRMRCMNKIISIMLFKCLIVCVRSMIIRFYLYLVVIIATKC